MATFLHISDLHRDTGSRLTTNSLLESLRLDRDRYVNEGVNSPDIAIVSGDIVYGVTSSEAGSDEALKAQYDEAHEFLVRLAELFFAGDRDRVILIPGNHDVSHPHVLRSSAVEDLPTEREKRAVLAKQLATEGTPWRWVWAEFALRRVTDQSLYHQRLRPFADFYGAFYEGRRSFSLDPSQQLALHDFPDLGVVVVGLSSCCDNDLFNRMGRIHPDCVAAATREVAHLARRGRLPMAVWHHNLSGGPKDSDYVDAEFLQSLMDGGFLLGFHGHQHRPQFIEHRFTADRKKALAVISAGTLCGGPHSLPSGRMRAYNLVSVDPATGKGSLHVRDMKNSDFSLPVWGASNVPEFGGSTMSFELGVIPTEKLALEAASEAADRLRRGDAQNALALVRPHRSNEFARRVAIEALLVLEDWEGIESFCAPPESNPELVALFEAHYQLGHRPALRSLLETQLVIQNTNAAVRQSAEQAWARLGGNR